MPQPVSGFDMPARLYITVSMSGADVQAVKHQVVRGVHDDGERPLGQRVGEADGELGASHPSCKRNDRTGKTHRTISTGSGVSLGAGCCEG